MTNEEERFSYFSFLLLLTKNNYKSLISYFKLYQPIETPLQRKTH